MNQIKETCRKLPMVVCECGFKLLVVLDLDEIAHSIEEHAATHGNGKIYKEKMDAEHCRIEELLAQKVLISINKSMSSF